MKIKYNYVFILLITPMYFFSQEKNTNLQFEKLNNPKNWIKTFNYKGSEVWNKYWFLDGKLATITNSKKGMHFSAGPVDNDDAHHAVLWTKDYFKGDLKMEFDYTKTDTMQKNVCILYIQATGIGTQPYDKDISKWNKLRDIPSMRTYFNNMNSLHISFAASTPIGKEYIRARRYPVTSKISFNDIVITPSYDDLDGLFVKDIPYHITVLKTNEKLFFKVQSQNTNQIFYWDLSTKEPITEGRIGLRHMFTRSALYKNIKIYTLKNEK